MDVKQGDSVRIQEGGSPMPGWFPVEEVADLECDWSIVYGISGARPVVKLKKGCDNRDIKYVFERIRSVPAEPRCEICGKDKDPRCSTVCKQHLDKWYESYMPLKAFIAAEKAKLEKKLCEPCPFDIGDELCPLCHLTREEFTVLRLKATNRVCHPTEAQRPIQVGDEVECTCGRTGIVEAITGNGGFMLTDKHYATPESRLLRTKEERACQA